MTDKISSYNIFFKLIESYGPMGFSGINPNDLLIAEAERMMNKNDQFFYFGDLIQFKILYTSKRSLELMGIEPSILNPSVFFEAGHPDEMHRHLIGRSVLMKIAYDLSLAKQGFKLLSSCYHIRHKQGVYNNLLMQFFIYYSTIPYKSVFLFKVHTNINWFSAPRHGFHYYLGDDLTNFRYPDNKLLQKGILFSKREFEIIQLIEQGRSSDEIAEKLFLSKNTVDTHRRNILHKAKKLNMAEVIHDLKEMGLL